MCRSPDAFKEKCACLQNLHNIGDVDHRPKGREPGKGLPPGTLSPKA